jgi:hypothetical protein
MNRRCRDEAGVVHAVVHTYPAEAEVYCRETPIVCLSFWTTRDVYGQLTCDGCRAALRRENGDAEDR